MANFTSEDVAYLSHGDRKIMARIFKPEGAGPFPCFIEPAWRRLEQRRPRRLAPASANTSPRAAW